MSAENLRTLKSAVLEGAARRGPTADPLCGPGWPGVLLVASQVEVARQMLSQTDEPMARVALAAGFSNAKQLGSSFQHETGTTPTAYRRQSRT